MVFFKFSRNVRYFLSFLRYEICEVVLSMRCLLSEALLKEGHVNHWLLFVWFKEEPVRLQCGQTSV